MNNKGHVIYIMLSFYIMLMPLNNSFEVAAMMNGMLPYGGWSIQLTPTLLKLYKDFFLVFFILFILFSFLKYNYCREVFSKVTLLPVFIFLLIVFSFSYFYILNDDVFRAILGLRSYLSLIYFLVGVSIGVCFDFRKIKFAFIFVFMLHLIMQIVQNIQGVGLPVFGEVRSPGIFIVPATAGVFSLLALFYFHQTKNRLLLFFSVGSLVLSTSTIGLLSVTIYIVYYLSDRFFNRNLIAKIIVLVCLLLLSISFFYYYAAQLSGRGNAVFESLGGRISIMTSFFENASIEDFMYGGRFGLVTAQAVLSKNDFGFIADNTFLGVYASMGFFAVIFLILFTVFIFLRSENKFLAISFLLYAMSSNVFELSPVSQLLFLFIGIHIGASRMTAKNNKVRLVVYSENVATKKYIL
ncbi:hypothetical protein [Aeromonas jandaei]|uniref:hypothetical protein n=1 Tax=Aeromonas jandaei TaxID=650 RepID=UPI00366DFB80